MGISTKKFKLTVYPAAADGTIGDLEETGFCSMDLATINLITLGRGDPDNRVSVDAGILGTFTECRKISIRFDRVSIENDVVQDRYKIQYKIDGADFGNVLGG